MDDKKPDGGGGWWTIPVLCLGLSIISVCLLVPQADANRRLDYERQKLLTDLDQINQQTAINEQFLGRLDNDPQLGQRLAQRQMRFIPRGQSVLPLPKQQATQIEVSPFSLVALPPPPALPEYVAEGGEAGQWMLDDHLRLYCLAGGLFLTAAGLVLSSNDGKSSRSGA